MRKWTVRPELPLFAVTGLLYGDMNRFYETSITRSDWIGTMLAILGQICLGYGMHNIEVEKLKCKIATLLFGFGKIIPDSIDKLQRHCYVTTLFWRYYHKVSVGTLDVHCFKPWTLAKSLCKLYMGHLITYHTHCALLLAMTLWVCVYVMYAALYM